MRTLEDMQSDYEIAKKTLASIEKERKKASKKCDKLYYEIENFKLQNRMYHQMSELKKHKGKEVLYIKLVVRDENGELSTTDMCNCEYFKVNEKGHLYFSSCNFGVMWYDEDKKKYSYIFNHRETLYDFVGYLEVDFDDDESGE